MKINSEKYCKSFAKFVLALCCIVAAMVPALFVSQLGAQTFDEPYQMLNALDYKNVPFAPLSNVFGGWFGSIFGYEWIMFRYLGVGLFCLSLLIACGYMWLKTRNYRQFLFFSTSLVFVSCIYRLHQVIYGWDSWTMPFAVLAVIVTLEYIDRKQLWQLVVLAVLTALLAMCRLPNVLILPILAAIIACVNNRAVRMRVATAYVVASLVAILVLTCALYGSPMAYLHYLSDNAIDDHSPLRFLWSYSNGLARNALYVSGIICSYFALKKSPRKWPVLLIVCYVFAYDMRYFLSEYNYSVLDVQVAVTLIMIYLAYSNAKDDASVQKIIAMAALALVPMLGSNTGIYKYMGLPLIPLLMIYLQNGLTKEMKQLGLAVFASQVILAPIATSIFSYGDVGYKQATYQFDDGLAKGLRTTDFRGEYVAQVMADVNRYAKDCDVIVLRSRHEYIFEYLLQSRNDYLRHRFNGADHNDKDYINWVMQQLNERHGKVAVLDVSYQPNTGMSSALSERCTIAVTNSDYTLYLKK